MITKITLNHITTRILYQYSSNPFRNQSPLNPTPKTPNSPSQIHSSKYQKPGMGTLHNITQQRHKAELEMFKKYKQSLPTLEKQNFIKDHLCEVVLYMRHYEVESQYVYALMNYQKLGFTMVSDQVVLKTLRNFLQNRQEQKTSEQPTNSASNKQNKKKVVDGNIWPVLKFSAPMQQSDFLVGQKQIINFLNKNELYRYEVQGDESISPSIQKYMQQKVMPELQALFWHPKLNYQQIFHINLSHYNKANVNYRLVYLFYTSIFKLFTTTLTSLLKILTNQQRYNNSRPNLQKAIKQITALLNGKQFIGGTKPSHLDFYILAVFNTRWSSPDFVEFLRRDVGGEFWAWMLRMRGLTQYDRERVTLI